MPDMTLETYAQNQTFVIFMIMMGVASVCAFVLMYHAWNASNVRPTIIPLKQRKDVNLKYAAAACDIKTQRERYLAVLMALLISGASLALIANSSVQVSYSMADARHHDLWIGIALTICGGSPSIMCPLALIMLIRVRTLKPSPFVRKIMFGANKGQYVLANPNDKRFGVPSYEAKFRDRQPSDMNHWKGPQDPTN
jgi:hypothetical protein